MHLYYKFDSTKQLLNCFSIEKWYFSWKSWYFLGLEIGLTKGISDMHVACHCKTIEIVILCVSSILRYFCYCAVDYIFAIFSCKMAIKKSNIVADISIWKTVTTIILNFLIKTLCWLCCICFVKAKSMQSPIFFVL